MRFDLVPSNFRLYMQGIARIGVIFAFLFMALVLLLIGIGVFHDVVTALTFVFSVIVFAVIVLYPWGMFHKTIQSTVAFSADRILVMDAKGHCWREIPYKSITALRVEEIADFFCGKNRETWAATYMCFFLNDNKEIPNMPYNKLFSNPGFFMMAYQEEALSRFQSMYTLHMHELHTNKARTILGPER